MPQQTAQSVCFTQNYCCWATGAPAPPEVRLLYLISPQCYLCPLLHPHLYPRNESNMNLLSWCCCASFFCLACVCMHVPEDKTFSSRKIISFHIIFYRHHKSDESRLDKGWESKEANSLVLDPKGPLSWCVNLTWRPRWCTRWRQLPPHERWVAMSEKCCFWIRRWLWVCGGVPAAGRAQWSELLMGRRSLDQQGVKEAVCLRLILLVLVLLSGLHTSIAINMNISL